MSLKRKLLTVLAIAAWAASVILLIASVYADLNADNWKFLHALTLAVAAVSTVCLVITQHVTEPRCAYRLGWDARGRHDARDNSNVTSMESQRRA